MRASRSVARIEATAHLKARYSSGIRIGISVNAGEESQSAMKRAGAVRLITKEAAIGTLYQIIETTMKGDTTVGKTGFMNHWSRWNDSV